MLEGSFSMISAYADDNGDDDYKDGLDQDVKQKNRNAKSAYLVIRSRTMQPASTK
jgi:hypothetical protein